MRQFTCPKAVTHPSTNRARCRATALIETNALPLHQTANRRIVVWICSSSSSSSSSWWWWWCWWYRRVLHGRRHLRRRSTLETDHQHLVTLHLRLPFDRMMCPDMLHQRPVWATRQTTIHQSQSHYFSFPFFRFKPHILLSILASVLSQFSLTLLWIYFIKTFYNVNYINWYTLGCDDLP